MTIDDLLASHPAEPPHGTKVLQTLTALTQSAAVITHGYVSPTHDEVRWVTRTVLRHDGQQLDRQEWTGPHLNPADALIAAGPSPAKEDFLAINGGPYVTLTTMTHILPSGVIFNRRHLRVPRHVEAVQVAGASFPVTAIGHVLLAWEVAAEAASVPAPLAAVWESGEVESWGTWAQAPRPVLIPGYEP
ncbi:hypothetical protein ACFEMC_22925 [Kineococcus sp. DHX-1]|uniref:hypothetical protein n=1 Tax=Kineococcus sp. DHX-1 TaxID=3349638 RepID=UPI0036D33A34